MELFSVLEGRRLQAQARALQVAAAATRGRARQTRLLATLTRMDLKRIRDGRGVPAHRSVQLRNGSRAGCRRARPLP